MKIHNNKLSRHCACGTKVATVRYYNGQTIIKKLPAAAKRSHKDYMCGVCEDELDKAKNEKLLTIEN